MAYPSVISQPGSSSRNLPPVLEGLAPLIEVTPAPKRVLELASYPYEHIRQYGQTWPEVHFTGTVRDSAELGSTNTEGLPENVGNPLTLDIAEEQDWSQLQNGTVDPYDGVIMLNLVHCTPEGLPENIFRNLSPRSERGRKILAPGAWIAAYGAYLNDDGSFRSSGDEKFDREHIKGTHPSLGLRTPASITAMANKWGFREVLRKDMPRGNLWIVWRAEA